MSACVGSCKRWDMQWAASIVSQEEVDSTSVAMLHTVSFPGLLVLKLRRFRDIVCLKHFADILLKGAM